MNTTHSLNDALTISMSVFLVTFVAYLVLSGLGNRRKARGTSESRERPPIARGPRQVSVSTPRAHRKGWNPATVRVRGALWAMAFSAVVFASVCFGPPGTHSNTADLSLEPPLRLTWLDYQPAARGFRLEGHVWNQSNDTLRNVQATVLALDASGKAIGQANGVVTPGALGPGGSGEFTISCDQTWPEVATHELRFRSSQNVSLEYVQQFPPTRVSFSGGKE